MPTNYNRNFLLKMVGTLRFAHPTNFRCELILVDSGQFRTAGVSTGRPVPRQAT